MSEHKEVSLVFPIKEDCLLLGMKKRGFGAGWWNGFGGKADPGELFEDCARRETREEIGLEVRDLRLVARLLFYFDNNLDMACAAFTTVDFTGRPLESDEMRPEWFKQSDIPYDHMWEADRLWLPKVLELDAGDAPLAIGIHFDTSMKLQQLDELTTSDVMPYFQQNG